MVGDDREAERDPDRREGVTFTDRRRIDPDTLRLRENAAPDSPAGEVPPGGPGSTGAGPGGAGQDPQAEDVAAAVAELTADVQRVQAEYANYRKRVERDREAVRDQAVASVLVALLPVLDDIGRAREHGELEGAFKAVGEAVEAATARLGLETFGAVGEAFDPTLHEALTHETREDAAGPTLIAVYQAGYRLGGRVVRPARVGVADTD
ncbi:MAG: nucleotide exchange factor GrpE [Actinomycetota bacterium]|nr:MAG: nucleotide exchange factor GrpE [Actinomycetota bacterium]